jgi:glycosyltransferase involved in cell wall biosynthesis
VPEVVENDRNGLLVPPQNPDALASAITRFFADPALRERLRAGATDFAKSHSPAVTHERLEELLRRALR